MTWRRGSCSTVGSPSSRRPFANASWSRPRGTRSRCWSSRLRSSPGMRASARALPSALPLGRRLQALFGSRITGLPPRTRQLLLRMALDGTGDVRVLAGGSGPERRLSRSRGGGAGTTRVRGPGNTPARVPPPPHTLGRRGPVAGRRTSNRAPRAGRGVGGPARPPGVASRGGDRRAERVGGGRQLEAAAARILARGDAVGCVKALTRASELSPRSAERRRRLAAAAYIGADVAGDLGNASNVLAELRRGDVEFEGSLQAAVAASCLPAERPTATSRPPIVCWSVRSRAGRAPETLAIRSSLRRSTPC